MHLLTAFKVLLALAVSATTALPGIAPVQIKAPTGTITAATSTSLIHDPTNPAILIPSSYPITGFNPQCNSYETVHQADANNIQNDLVAGQVLGGCCTTERNDCSLLNVNNTAAVQLCSTGGSQCVYCKDLAVAMKAIVTSCSATLLSSSSLVGGQVVIPWMVNTTLQINPAHGDMELSAPSNL